MKSSPVLCVLLCAVLSVRAAVLPAVTPTTPLTQTHTVTGFFSTPTPPTPTTTPTTPITTTPLTQTHTVTGFFTTPTPPTPTTTPTTPITTTPLTQTHTVTGFFSTPTPTTTPTTTTPNTGTGFFTTPTPTTTPTTPPTTITTTPTTTTPNTETGFIYTTTTPTTTPTTPITTTPLTQTSTVTGFFTTPTPTTTPTTPPTTITTTPTTITPNTGTGFFTTPTSTSVPNTPIPLSTSPITNTSTLMEVFTSQYSTAFSSSSSPPQPTAQPSSPSPSRLMCPDGWEVFQGRCYNFVNQPMSWPEAQSNCALLESMLASVHSAQEYNFLQQLTNNNGNEEAWLGGFYLQYQWLWIDGSWFYNNSCINETTDSSNPCLLLNSNEPWSNSPCMFGTPSICVKNSNVPPGMVCPQGWTGFQGRCYHYNMVLMTWPEADANCASLGASLVSVHSPLEYMFLFQQSSSPSWLGGFYIDDQWMWLDGSWFYQGFFGQMPPASTYQCLSTFSPDGWSPESCNQVMPSFCVKEALSYSQ